MVGVNGEVVAKTQLRSTVIGLLLGVKVGKITDTVGWEPLIERLVAETKKDTITTWCCY